MSYINNKNISFYLFYDAICIMNDTYSDKRVEIYFNNRATDTYVMNDIFFAYSYFTFAYFIFLIDHL